MGKNHQIFYITKWKRKHPHTTHKHEKNASLQGQIHCHTMLGLYSSSKVHCTSHFIQHEKFNSRKCEYANILTTLTHVSHIINWFWNFHFEQIEYSWRFNIFPLWKYIFFDFLYWNFQHSKTNIISVEVANVLWHLSSTQRSTIIVTQSKAHILVIKYFKETPISCAYLLVQCQKY